MTIAETAAELRRLHTDPELLQVVNVWDVASAKAVAALPQTRAIATASHSIAATFGYPDGEQIPVDLMLDMAGRIARAVELPVTADLEAGYGDPGETIRRAVGEGIVGANLEDQLKPLDASVASVAAAVAAAEAEGVPFVLNARTDAFLRGRDRTVEVNVADAIERGRAYLDAGATCVFVPGNFGEDVVAELVDGIGAQRVSLIGLPEIPSPRRLQELGVARLSYGPTRSASCSAPCRTSRATSRAGDFGEDVVAELVDGIGAQRVSLIGLPEIPSPRRLQELGVARLSYGPYPQRVVLGALQDLASDLAGGGVLPRDIRQLN